VGGTAIEEELKYPACFGKLGVVFPMGSDGLRSTPDGCMACEDKTECLRAAMAKPSGIDVREEMVDRAYAAGQVGFLERWFRRKTFSREKSNLKNSNAR
jgi:hypothetical protein